MPKQYINPDALFPSVQYGFSQGVVVTGAKTIYLSGQTARQAHGKMNVRSDLAEQARQSLRNVETALASAGAAFADIVTLRIYIVNYHPEQNAAVSKVLREFFPAEARPCSTWIGVAALASPEYLIEIEATAVVE